MHGLFPWQIKKILHASQHLIVCWSKWGKNQKELFQTGEVNSRQQNLLQISSVTTLDQFMQILKPEL